MIAAPFDPYAGHDRMLRLAREAGLREHDDDGAFCGVRFEAADTPQLQSFADAVLREAAAAPLPAWGFYAIDDVLRDPTVLVSVHRTKAGAWRAMHRAQWDAWVELQRVQNLPRAIAGRPRDRGEKLPSRSMRYIGPVEVQP